MDRHLLDYGRLPTEQPSATFHDLDLLDERQLVALIHQQDRLALAAVEQARDALAAVITVISDCLAAGRRLIYVGAGTSGRLGVLDAAECPPTFGTSPRQIIALIAGGPRAFFRAVEGAEDDRAAGRTAIQQQRMRPREVVCGISASGVTPFVRAALDEARRSKAVTVLITCAPRSLVAQAAHYLICLDVGGELLAGSTRMKAALATKAVLHTLSTATMIRLGKVHDNLMVDVKPTNRKLRQRAIRIVSQLTGLSPRRADALLVQAGQRPKIAVVMHQQQVSARRARQLLAQQGGRLRPLLGARDQGEHHGES